MPGPQASGDARFVLGANGPPEVGRALFAHVVNLQVPAPTNKTGRGSNV